jgi:hypothetical protein
MLFPHGSEAHITVRMGFPLGHDDVHPTASGVLSLSHTNTDVRPCGDPRLREAATPCRQRYPCAFRPNGDSTEIGAASGALASGSERPLSKHAHIGAGQIGNDAFPPGGAIRGPSRPSTALDPEPTAQADPNPTFTTSPVGDRVGQKAAIRTGLTPLRQSPAQSICRAAPSRLAGRRCRSLR